MDKTAQSGTGKRLVNTLFNPFTDDTLAGAGASPRQKSLTHAAGLLAGYGGLSFLLRQLARADLAGRDEADIAEVRESAKVRGKEEEAIEMTKKAGWSLEDQVRKWKSGEADPKRLALALAATAGGLYGGYKISDRLADISRKDDLTDEITDRRQRIEGMLMDEFKRTRGMEEKTAGIGTFLANPLASMGSAAVPLYWTWVAAALALSYKASKDYFDKGDPNRQKMDTLKEIAKDRSRMTGAPKFSVSPDIRMLEEQAKKGFTEVPKERDLSSVALPEHAEAGNLPVDKRDPYAAALQV